MSEQRAKRSSPISESRLASLTTMGMGVAHHFNNLLAAILGNAIVVKKSLPEDSSAAEGIRQIEGCARRGLDLTRRILTFTGRAPFSAQPIALSDLALTMEDPIKGLVSEGITVRVAAGRDVPLITGDAAQVRQLILELAMNASEALIETRGALTVETGILRCDRDYLDSVCLGRSCREGVYAYLQVSDTGRGMPMRTRRRMFDPFFTTKLRGQGLGLGVVLGVLRAHKGALEVWSRHRQGSRFKALFPAVNVTSVE